MSAKRFISRWKWTLLAALMMVLALSMLGVLVTWVWYEAAQQPDITIPFPLFIFMLIISVFWAAAILTATARLAVALWKEIHAIRTRQVP